MYWVYVIRGRNGYHYTGYTSDLAKRLEEHNRGKSYSVRGRGPFEIILTEKYSTRLEAIQREKRIKKLKNGDAFKRLIAKGNIVMSPSSSLV